MLSFLEYLEENKTDDEIGITPDLIHFKHISMSMENTNQKTFPTSVHFKHVPGINEEKRMSSSFPSFKEWIEENPNRHLGDNSSQVSDALSKQKKQISPEQQEAITAYSAHNDTSPGKKEQKKHWHSFKINSALVKGKPVPKALRKTHDNLDSAIRQNPLTTELHTYSGVSFDPRKHLDENGRMRSPAFMSTTHSKKIADHFAVKAAISSQTFSTGGGVHIMHFHLKPGDPALPINDLSHFKDEHETILGKGLTLQYIRTDVRPRHPGPFSSMVHEHHFSIVRD